MNDLPTIYILIVEEFHAETEAVVCVLDDAELPYELRIAASEDEFKEKIGNSRPDIILSPYSLSNTNAVKLLSIARGQNIDTPFILMAYDLSEDIAIELLGQGMEDYVLRSTIKRIPEAIRKTLQRHKTLADLKISRERLQSSEAALRNMVKNSPMAVAMFDTEMNYLVVSDVWLRQENKTDEELIGRNHYDVVPEVPESWRETHRRCLRGEMLFSEREEVPWSKDQSRFLRWKMNPWFSSDGIIGGAVLFIEDITERIAAQDAIIKDQRLMALGQEISRSGNYEMDLSTGELLWSDNLYRITGFSRNDNVSNEKFLSCVHPDDRKRFSEKFELLLRTREPFPIYYRFIRPDNGQQVHFHVDSAFIMDDRNKSGKLIGSVRDVTMQIELKESKKAMFHELEWKVEQRTKELRQKNEELNSTMLENLKIRDDLAARNLDLTDSIQYAKQIQESILPSKQALRKSFTDHFILFRPRDIVSGDFYWHHRHGSLSCFAAVDCTGHGVPGALMSMIAYELLNQTLIFRRLTDPATILLMLNKLMVRTLRQKQRGLRVQDGMDIGICMLDHDANTLSYAGAHTQLYLVHDNVLDSIPGKPERHRWTS